MKYKVGDKVKVHTKEWFEKNCNKNYIDAFEHEDGNNTFVSDMIEFCGREVTINHIGTDNYIISEDDGLWYWQDWMFEDTNDEDISNNINIISNPNIVEDFAKLIGVELGEEFYSKESSWCYKFTADNGLMVYDNEKEDWRVASAYPLTAFFKMIKEGKFIKKWTPKDGDIIYFPSFCCDALWVYKIYHNKEKLESGLYFKTQKEAVECAKKIIKQMKEG